MTWQQKSIQSDDPEPPAAMGFFFLSLKDVAVMFLL